MAASSSDMAAAIRSTTPGAPAALRRERSVETLFSITFDKTAFTKRVSMMLSLMSDFSTSVNVRFCDDVEIEKLNSEFRQKNQPTDVLSFPVSPNESRDPEENSIGDILICVPVCECQAREAGHSLAAELEKMTLHGIVHLKGFDHERNDGAWRVMTGLEELIQDEVIKTLGAPEWCQINETSAKKRSKEKTL